MKKSKAIIRKWIPPSKVGPGHWSHCRRGHPWKVPGPCIPCRIARDAARHATPESKVQEAARKKERRWALSTNLNTFPLLEGYFVDIWRGSVRLRSPLGYVILPPAQAVLLYEVLRDDIGRKPPSKLPKAIQTLGKKRPAKASKR